MTNEELVALIQTGDRGKLAELWNLMEKFVALQANRRIVFTNGLGGVTAEDLYQSGYIALVAAADSYNLEAGCSFIGWLALALKTAFAEAGGYRTTRRDPLNRAGSLDAPVGEDEAGATVGELQPDPAAVQAFQDVEERLYQEQLHAALERVLATLRRRYYQGQTLDNNTIPGVLLDAKNTLVPVRGQRKNAEFVRLTIEYENTG